MVGCAALGMTPHALVSVCVRFLGIILVAVSTPTVVCIAHDVFQQFMMGNGWGRLSPFIEYDREREAMGYLGWFLLAAAGTYMFLDGGWVVARLTRGLAGACAHCGYDLRGAPGAVCPECGGTTLQAAGGAGRVDQSGAPARPAPSRVDDTPTTAAVDLIPPAGHSRAT